MPKSSESINQDLEDLLVSKGYDVTALDSSGKEVPVADDAEIFQFHFHRGGKDYGTVTISIDGLQKLTIYYDDEVAGSGTSDSDRGMNGTSWISLVKQLKKFALQHQLGFVLKDTDRLRSDMQRRNHTKKISESIETEKEIRSTISDYMDKAKQYIARNNKSGAQYYVDKIKELRTQLPQSKSGLDIDRSTPGITRATLSDVEPGTMGKKLEKLQAYHSFQAGVADQGRSGRVRPKIASDNFTQRDDMNEQQLAEGYYGNKKMSYSDDTPQVKMIIKHNRQLEETDQRFRHIERIFLETSDGERFSVPTNKPSRARVFARHIAEGGEYKDDRWSHITEICEDLDSLGGFVRATKGREQFNESAQRMIIEAQDQYHQLRETVKKLTSSRGYNNYFESYEPKVITEADADLLEAFKNSTIDSRIERALPTLSKFGIKRGKLDEADMFENWANEILDETLGLDNTRQVEELTELLLDTLPVGPNAEVAIGELRDIIEDDELYDRLRKAAVADPDSDARPQIIAWMQEQDNEDYRRVLDQIEIASAEEDSSVETEPSPAADSENKPEPTEKSADNSADDSSLPPLKEDDVLSSFKKLLRK